MNAPILPNALAELWRRQREAILVEYPDIDETTLADTLDGNSMLPDMLAGMVRIARERDAQALALKSMIGDMQERKARFERGAERLREAVFLLMEQAGIPKIERPDFSASIRNNPARVIITDEATVPDQYCRISRLPNLNDIRAALKDNIAIPGVTLGNGGRSIAVRVK